MTTKRRRWYYDTGLNPPVRSAYLLKQDADFRDEKLAAGVPLSAIARMLGLTEETLRRGHVVDFSGETFPATPKREPPSEAEREARRWERQRTRTWHAPDLEGRR